MNFLKFYIEYLEGEKKKKRRGGEQPKQPKYCNHLNITTNEIYQSEQKVIKNELRIATAYANISDI